MLTNDSISAVFTLAMSCERSHYPSEPFLVGFIVLDKLYMSLSCSLRVHVGGCRCGMQCGKDLAHL